MTNLFDVMVTVTMLVHEPSLMRTHSPSEILQAIQRDLAVLVNQIVVYSSPDVVKAAAHETIYAITLAVIDK